MEKTPNFPEHMILEILLRLPVKSLVRFKCVSKSFRYHISDPNFTKSHYDVTASRRPCRFLFDMLLYDSGEAQIHSIVEASFADHYVNHVSPIPSSIGDRAGIMGARRGFILLGYNPKRNDGGWTPRHLLVWNPSTGVHKTLSHSAIGSEFNANTDDFTGQYSFEYDGVSDDYLVIIAWIERLYHDYGMNRIHTFEFLCLRTNAWKQIDATHLPYSRHDGRHQFVYFNGAIHWFASSNTGEDEPIKAIIALDLIEGSLSEIPLPHYDFFFSLKLRLCVIGGCLCLCYGPGQPGCAELWVMKEYKVKSSWTKSNYVPDHAIPFPDCHFRPTYFTEDGQIIGTDYNYELVKLNDKGELLHLHEFYHADYIYTESLLSLPSASGQAEADDQQ